MKTFHKSSKEIILEIPQIYFNLLATNNLILSSKQKFRSRMILKMKVIFLILIIKFRSGQSTCRPKGRQLKILPSKIPKSIGSYATEDGYSVDWEGAIQPRDMAGCLDEVVLHYNGGPDTGCCDGYQEVTKKPRSGDLEPFLIPELCGNKTTTDVFVTFKIQQQKQTSGKLTLTNLRACPEENKSLFDKHKDLFKFCQFLYLCWTKEN